MRVSIPDFSLVVLIGPTGAGKTTLASKHFLPTEVVSSDFCRATVSDDETSHDSTADAFELLQFTAAIRLRRRKLTVIDATSVNRPDRAQLVALARKYHALPVALVLDIDPALCHQRNTNRDNRAFGPHVARNHSRALRRGLKGLSKEGFRKVHIMRSAEEVEALELCREPLWIDRRWERGPFDIIGDVHGCFEELVELLKRLGYEVAEYQPGEELLGAYHPQGRIAVFAGDLTDRGPRNIDSLRLAMGMCAAGTARCVIGNHDSKLLRWLNGRKVQLNHGLDLTVAELQEYSEEFRSRVAAFIDGLVSHLWFADGQLVVAHAGLKENMHGRGSGAVRSFAMYGDTTGEIDEFGLPVRLEWANDYRGKADVVYGHTPVVEAQWLNSTICIDTGCVFGGKLTALRWPERETVAVASKEQYAKPARPVEQSSFSDQQSHDRLLYFDEFACRQRIETRIGATVSIPQDNAIAALEVTSRFGIDPRWLIYLPPTMAACPTAPNGPYLEHPDQALDYYVNRGVTELVAQEKHMGSRAIFVICKSADVARGRFGTEDGKQGVVYTRTGRPFFSDEMSGAALVERIANAITAANLWQELQTDWIVLDAELMPWSAKAQALLRTQYLPTVAAAQASARALLDLLDDVTDSEALVTLRETARGRLCNAQQMDRVISGYCWETNSIADLKIAPFHILAAAGQVFAEQPHSWHMEIISRLAERDSLLQTTQWELVDGASEHDRQRLVQWWHNHTEAGGEGMVLKPTTFLARDNKGLAQPAMKVRGKDYLRIIYGPDYDEPRNIERLRSRGLGRKFSLAEREFRLGLEGLYRFVEKAPLSKVHACALGVLALESEPVDPRL